MKFSIRDLLWLIVVAALAVGWMVDRWRSESKRIEEQQQEHRIAEAWEGRAWAMKIRMESGGWRVDWKPLEESRNDSYDPLPIPLAPAQKPPKDDKD